MGANKDEISAGRPYRPTPGQLAALLWNWGPRLPGAHADLGLPIGAFCDFYYWGVTPGRSTSVELDVDFAANFQRTYGLIGQIVFSHDFRVLFLE